MKSALFFLVTMVLGLASAKPLTKRDPIPPAGALNLPGPTPPIEGSGLSNLTPGKDFDITDAYIYGRKKINRYGACVALQEGDKFIKSTVFTAFVTCDVYNDAKCKGPKEPMSILLPPSELLHSSFNPGPYFAKAYICKPFIQGPIPTDLQHDEEQIRLSGPKMG